jgi:hypothetical protein
MKVGLCSYCATHNNCPDSELAVRCNDTVAKDMKLSIEPAETSNINMTVLLGMFAKLQKKKKTTNGFVVSHPLFH